MVVISDLAKFSWLTAFIFAAQDYNWHHNCRNIPRGATCSKKYAQEAFIFLALYEFLPIWYNFVLTGFASFFTLTGIGLEFWSYWADRRANTTAPVHAKPRHDPEAGPSAAGGPPLDAPAEPATNNV
jgi:hypothetical protein